MGRRTTEPTHPTRHRLTPPDTDTDTDEILVHKHVTVGDVGKAINPMQVESQDEGAAIMGLGLTLMEHFVLKGTERIRNLGALDYRIPPPRTSPSSCTPSWSRTRTAP